MKRKAAELVLDFDFYPRGKVDATHVGHLVQALQAGAVLPPVIICAKTRRISDGFHRHRAHLRVFGEDVEIEVIEKDYADDAAFFLDAMRHNAAHGRALDPHDRVRCILRARDLAITPEIIASALQITTDTVGELTTGRVGKLTAGPRRVALKFPIRHMAGQTLTPEQATANDKLGGNNQLFLINQLTLLLETGLFDWSNTTAADALWRLGDLIEASRRSRAA